MLASHASVLELCDLRRHAAAGGEDRRPPAERHLVLGVVGDGDDRPPHQLQVHAQRVVRPRQHARFQHILLRRRRSWIRERAQKRVERHAGDEHGALPPVNQPGRHRDHFAFGPLRTRERRSLRFTLNARFRHLHVLVPRVDRFLLELGGGCGRRKSDRRDGHARADEHASIGNHEVRDRRGRNRQHVRQRHLASLIDK